MCKPSRCHPNMRFKLRSLLHRLMQLLWTRLLMIVKIITVLLTAQLAPLLILHFLKLKDKLFTLMKITDKILTNIKDS